MTKLPTRDRQRKSEGFLERLWAFLRVREMLDKMDATKDEAAKAKALELSLKYGFVTPLTSLVVVRQDKVKEVGKPKEESLDSEYQNFGRRTYSSATGATGGVRRTFFSGRDSATGGVQYLKHGWVIFLPFVLASSFITVQN